VEFVDRRDCNHRDEQHDFEADEASIVRRPKITRPTEQIPAVHDTGCEQGSNGYRGIP
jgi:hypothetical protein